MLAHRERRLFTHEEYFAIEESSDTKSEFYRGEIFAMSGGSVEHNQIARKLLRLVDTALDGTACQVFFADLRLNISAYDLITYPDLFVACGSLKRLPGRKDTLTDATMVIEVLSPKTELYDQSEKFLFYKSLPSFKEYLLVSQSQAKVERHHRSARGEWRSSQFGPGQSFSLKSIHCEIAVDEVYRGVDLLGGKEG